MRFGCICGNRIVKYVLTKVTIATKGIQSVDHDRCVHVTWHEKIGLMCT